MTDPCQSLRRIMQLFCHHRIRCDLLYRLSRVTLVENSTTSSTSPLDQDVDGRFLEAGNRELWVLEGSAALGL
jgi:hypothetical protein